MARKRKCASETEAKKKSRHHSPQYEGPHHIGPPNTNQLTPSGFNQGITAPSITISPSNRQPTSAGPTLRPVEQSDRAAEQIANTGTASFYSAITQDHSWTGYRPAPEPSSLRPRNNTSQGFFVHTDPHSIQDNRLQGNFANAHDFTIGSAVFYNSDRPEEGRRAREEQRSEERKAREEEREVEEKKQEKEALEKLVAKGMPGAMLDSKDRGYVPRCNEDTRTALRVRVIQWGRYGAGIRRLFWLSGPAGVGKSAVAQTVAEAFKEAGLLGAAFFFSRPNNRSDPDVLIPTLVYQLASLLPEYQRIITQLLTKDPLILNRNRRSQFKELIINPFLSLTARLPSITQKPIFILLDGLDECNDREAQCEFVEMISHHTHKEGPALRLRWMVCSRPEPHLKVAFSRTECKAICLEEKLEVDDTEAQGDARRILVKGFAEIRQKYPDQLTEDWPPEDQLHFIADRASGHLGFVSFIIRFIGDKHYDDPFSQLEVCLRFLERTGGSTDLNPLHLLDLLYTQILSDIPTGILPTTQLVLGLFIFYGHKGLTAAIHANFLGLTQAAFYRSLQHLHSVLSVPSAYEANMKGIQIYHASFSDYLKDETRSGKFFLKEGMVPYFEVAVSGLKWLGHGHNNPSKRAEPLPTWIPPKASREGVLDSLCRFSFTPCWEACIKVPDDSLAALFRALDKFDFDLDYVKWWKNETKAFVYFIRWLVTSGHHLVVAAGKHPGMGISIFHKDDPHSFTLPFSEDMRFPGANIIRFRLGIPKPIPFWLDVSQTCSPSFNDLLVDRT